jgi:nuclear migration protein JNM1
MKQPRNSKKQKREDVCISLFSSLRHFSLPVLVRAKTEYAYPHSPDLPSSPNDAASGSRSVSLSQRLRTLQHELVSLESELADPANPLIQKEREEEHLDPGELIRGLVDVRTRLDKIKKGKEGRARLVNVVLDGDIIPKEMSATKDPPMESKILLDTAAKSEIQVMVEIDQRVGELERIVGSSSTALDEVRSVLRCIHIFVGLADFSSFYP